ncbi:hypothetical protein NPIL_444361 [Nephila pilipes]|uniref:Uncharacterized protein n=1 Tax=Nephila pilipes TaxID=299642 RepID=A0A8X6T163_NEPPI|nr:hypothetical protein NPIL_444361 [Nephila pilipes]
MHAPNSTQFAIFKLITIMASTSSRFHCSLEQPTTIIIPVIYSYKCDKAITITFIKFPLNSHAIRFNLDPTTNIKKISSAQGWSRQILRSDHVQVGDYEAWGQPRHQIGRGKSISTRLDMDRLFLPSPVIRTSRLFFKRPSSNLKDRWRSEHRELQDPICRLLPPIRHIKVLSVFYPQLERTGGLSNPHISPPQLISLSPGCVLRNDMDGAMKRKRNQGTAPG